MRQKRAVAILQARGGIVYYHPPVAYDPSDALEPDPSVLASARDWFTDRLGKDFVSSVYKITMLPNYDNLVQRRSHFNTSCQSLLDNVLVHRVLRTRSEPIDDGGLYLIGQLTGLKELDLRWADISNQGIVHLRCLKSLENLDLSYTEIDDGALCSVGEFVRLEALGLRGTRISDSGVRWLRRLRHLRHLALDNTGVSWNTDDRASVSQNLVSLSLRGTKIADAGLQRLCASTQVEQLYLSGTAVTDKGLRHLRAQKRLREVALDDCNVTDKGLEALHSVTTLESVWLDDTATTRLGITALAKALPKCEIHWRTK